MRVLRLAFEKIGGIALEFHECLRTRHIIFKVSRTRLNHLGKVHGRDEVGIDYYVFSTHDGTSVENVGP